jgi:hypothetical protein
MQLNSVDLPAPFGPISATHSPRSTVTDTSMSAAIPAKRFVIPIASSSGDAADGASSLPSPGLLTRVSD